MVENKSAHYYNQFIFVVYDFATIRCKLKIIINITRRNKVH